MKESELYPLVREFIKNKYKCFYVTIEAGKEGIGSIDVFGVYHKNLEKTEIETVGVEVKIKKIPISAKFGQAKGYSLFCHKVYFASLDKFESEDIQIAKHLGMGLISLGKTNNSNFTCSEVLEPPENTPIPKLLNLILERKNLFICNSCKVIENRSGKYTETIYNFDKIYNYTKKAVKEGKGLLIKNKDKKEFYCNECARIKLNLK